MAYIKENYRKWWFVSLTVLLTLLLSVWLNIRYFPTFSELVANLENVSELTAEMYMALEDVYELLTNPVFILLVILVGLVVKVLFYGLVLKRTLAKDQRDEVIQLYPNFKSIIMDILPALYAHAGGYLLRSVVYLLALVFPFLLVFINVMITLAFSWLLTYFMQLKERVFTSSYKTVWIFAGISLILKILF